MTRRSPGSIISSVSRNPSIPTMFQPPPGDEGDDVAFNPAHHTKIKVEWSYENEEILAEWGDIAQCYRWLNHYSHEYYSSLNAWFTIPTITFSTISGTASFASASIPVTYQEYAPMVIGSINILIGILTTIQQYLKVAELKESHRLAAIAWDKYARNITIELTKTPKERIDAATFLKFSRREFDRLMESNQSIPPHIVARFRRIYRGRNAEERARFRNIKKPDICDVMLSINDKRRKWFTESDTLEAVTLMETGMGPDPYDIKSEMVHEEDESDGSHTLQEYELNRQNTDMNRMVGSVTEGQSEVTDGEMVENGTMTGTETMTWTVPGIDIEMTGVVGASGTPRTPGTPGTTRTRKQDMYARTFSRENLMKHDTVLKAEDEEEKKRRWGLLPYPTPTPTPRSDPIRRGSSREYLDAMVKTMIQQPISGIRDTFLKTVFRPTPTPSEEDGGTPCEPPLETPRVGKDDPTLDGAFPSPPVRSSPKSSVSKADSRNPVSSSGGTTKEPARRYSVGKAGTPIQISSVRVDGTGRRRPSGSNLYVPDRSDRIPTPTRPPASDSSHPVTLVPFHTLTRNPPTTPPSPPKVDTTGAVTVTKKRVTHEADYIVMGLDIPRKTGVGTPAATPAATPVEDLSPASSMSDEHLPLPPILKYETALENIVISQVEEGMGDDTVDDIVA